MLYDFEHMQTEGFSPDAVNSICTLKVFRNTETMHIREQIHDKIMSMQLLEGYIVLVPPLWIYRSNVGCLQKQRKC